ncbi:MAG: DUF3300 domain-containing protein [Phycisphaerae bacterium]|nr:DUF3300 domain-containing protein [Phycisphaerae bacterium]
MLVRSVASAVLAATFTLGCLSAEVVAQSSVQTPQGAGLSQADLEELVGPIALYPDPLLANVLAASVYPDEVQAAGAYLKKGGDPKKAVSQGWEEPVATLAQVPDALKMLVDYPDWTVALGRAYITQSTDLMKAVQELRRRAWDNGSLKSTPQQVVAQSGDTIVIQPAQPQVIYVPQYNPQVVYVDNSSDAVVAGVIGFGVGVAVGAIIANNWDCDWHGGYVCWGPGWGYHGHWSSNNNTNININNNNNINIGSGNVNIGNGNNNINRPRPGGEGGRWQPDASKVRPSQWGPDAGLSNWKGVGEGTRPVAGRVPGRTDNTPIARPSTRPAGANAPSNRPSTMPATKPSLPSSRPSMPSSIPQSRPAQSKPGGFDMDNGSKDFGNRGKQSIGGGSKPAAKPSVPAARPSAPAYKPAPKPAPRTSGSFGGGGGGGGSRGGGGGGRGGGGRR